jgi:HMG (high mobility group) box
MMPSLLTSAYTAGYHSGPFELMLNVEHRPIHESSPEIKVASQPRDPESLDLIPNALEIPYPGPSVSICCSPTSSIPDDPDAPVSLRNQKRDPSHVPRPLNSFFLFKTDWLAKRKALLAGIEQDHRQLNRMASSEWRRLPPEAKQRFKDAANKAKLEHAIKYPGYRFAPKPRGDRRKRKTKRNEPEILQRNEEAARLVSQGLTGDALREALAEYDRRSTEAKQHSACRPDSPPSFSERQSPTTSASSPITLYSGSTDADQSHDWITQPSFNLETLCDAFVGSHSAHGERGVALSQHSSAADRSQPVPVEPGSDPHLFHVNHLLNSYASLSSQTSDPSIQVSHPDEHIHYPTDWGQRATHQTVTLPTHQAFETTSGFIQSTANASVGSAYQNDVAQADFFLQSSPSMTWVSPF